MLEAGTKVPMTDRTVVNVVDAEDVVGEVVVIVVAETDIVVAYHSKIFILIHYMPTNMDQRARQAGRCILGSTNGQF